MCRLYKSKKGDYIRCCAATGHQGLRLPVNEAVFGKGGHVLFGNKSNPNSHKPKQYHGCIICGGPVSSHEKICSLCKEGK